MLNMTSDTVGNIIFCDTTLKVTVEVRDDISISASWIVSPSHRVGSRHITMRHLSQFVNEMKTWRSGFLHFDTCNRMDVSVFAKIM
jgi:hypothetical protein